ncbi:ash family protein [Volucribacter amazonae]|uniref:Uncharacterized protein n=1 Tax=Volucribacter amazonae TaxID=256731 RepID=A0A9X4P847_9PAST|nr:ash family protein [Volucribacter amazonae]MDG6894395.1 hypothetical protein [Volucribacter amazonae]
MKPSNNTTIYTKKALQQNGFKAILLTQSQKTIAEPENSNDKLVANSTPKEKRAFFVRDFRTPKENNRSNFGLVAYHSMMAYSGQSLAIGCFPVKAVSHPAIRYRQTVRSLAIAFDNLFTGLLAMKTFTKLTALFTPIALTQTVKGGIYA